jgi:putative ABC transport system permease protein
MRALDKLRLRFRSVFRRGRVEAALEDELRFHLDELVNEDIAAGMTPEEARRSALRSMGRLTTIQEECRDMRGTKWMDDFLRDLAYAWRSFTRNPMFFVSAILILAVGIGANSAVFAVVRTVVLNPLPFPNPRQLVIFWKADRKDNAKRSGIAPADYLDLRNQFRSCGSIAAFANTFFDVTGVEEPYRVFGARVSSNFFSTLGVRPPVGRDFVADDDQPAANRVAILSYSLWQRRFNGRPEIVGQSLTLNQERYTIIGVMPANLIFPEFIGAAGGPELWTSLRLAEERMERGSGYMRIVARLNTGTSLETVRAELEHLSHQFETSQPRAYGGKFLAVVPLHENVVGGVRQLLLVLWAAVICVLAITCTNLANMLLVRSTARMRELAVRASLGAGHWRLTRQLLTENIALGVCGGSLGLALAFAAIRAVPSMGLDNFPRIHEIAIDGWIVAFSLGLSTITALFFGALPAWKISRVDPQRSMQQGNRITGDRRGSFLRTLFGVAQVSLALILVTGAGLLIRSLIALQKADLGFQAENLLTFQLPLAGEKSRGERAGRYYSEVAQRISRLPGVQSVGMINYLPLRGNVFAWALAIQGRDMSPGAAAPQAEYRVVAGDLFSALGIRIKSGRGFEERDNREAPPVAVINETMARRYWPGEDPIGKQLRLGGPLAMFPWLTVIGVVSDVRYGEVEAAPEPTMYQPLSQARGGSLYVVVRTNGNPMAPAGAIRNEVRNIDRSVPVLDVREFGYYLSESFAQRRLVLAVLSSFAGIALFLAAFGIYSVVAYSVTQRTQEIGLRVALGAQRRGVLKLVLMQGMRISIGGIAAGIAGTLAFARVMTTLVYAVSPTDPVTIGFVCMLLLLVTIVASYVPAARALRIDPVVALKFE